MQKGTERQQRSDGDRCSSKALNDAVTALVQRGNTDALKALIEEYKDLKEADYTADSWKEYADALKAAKAIVEDNSNSDQAAVDAALNALRDARVALKLSGNRLLIRASFRQLTTSTKIRRTTVTQQRAGRSLKRSEIC